MKRGTTTVRAVGAALAVALAVPAARADECQPAGESYPGRGLVYHPAGPGEGEDRFAVGGLWLVAPMFSAVYRRGLPAGFTVDARLTTVIVRNQLDLGAAWAAPAGPFHLGLKAHVGGWFGALGAVNTGAFGFDSTGWGLLVDPGAFAGLRVARDSWLTLDFEWYLAPYQAVNLGGTVITPSHAPVNQGFSANLVVEYNLSRLGRGVVYYGLGLNHTVKNFPVWVAVDFSEQKIWYGSLFAGYEF